MAHFSRPVKYLFTPRLFTYGEDSCGSVMANLLSGTIKRSRKRVFPLLQVLSFTYIVLSRYVLFLSFFILNVIIYTRPPYFKGSFRTC